MPKLAFVALESWEGKGVRRPYDLSFQRLPFSQKLERIKQHIEHTADNPPKGCDTQVVVMGEFLLGPNVTASENVQFKQEMQLLTEKYPNLVIIGNSSPKSYYKVIDGVWIADPNNDPQEDMGSGMRGREAVAAAPHADEKEEISHGVMNLATIKRYYNTPAYELYTTNDTGVLDGNMFGPKESVKELGVDLDDMAATVKVGVVTNNTYVFQNGTYEHHSKKTPKEEPIGSIKLLVGRVFYRSPIKENLLHDLERLKTDLRLLANKDTLFLMDDKIYLWAWGAEAPTEIVSDNLALYEEWKDKLNNIQKNTSLSSSKEDLRDIQELTGIHYELPVAIFCPGSPQSKEIFSIKTPNMERAITLGIDTCREYEKRVLKGSQQETLDVHLVVSNGMTFNGRPKENSESSNCGSYFVGCDLKQPLALHKTVQSIPNDLEVVGYRGCLNDANYTLSPAIQPDALLLDRKTLLKLNELDEYVSSKLGTDPGFDSIKAELKGLFNNIYGSVKDETKVYKQLNEALQHSPFKPLPKDMEDRMLVRQIVALSETIAEHLRHNTSVSALTQGLSKFGGRFHTAFSSIRSKKEKPAAAEQLEEKEHPKQEEHPEENSKGMGNH